MARDAMGARWTGRKEDGVLSTKPKPEHRPWFRVIRSPTSDEWRTYDIVDDPGFGLMRFALSPNERLK